MEYTTPVQARRHVWTIRILASRSSKASSSGRSSRIWLTDPLNLPAALVNLEMISGSVVMLFS